jgi:hypothetical protein
MTTMTPAPLEDEDQDLVLLSNLSDLPSSSIRASRIIRKAAADFHVR